MGEHHGGGCHTFALGGLANDLAQHVPHQRFDALCGPTDDDGHRVTEAALELARRTRRLCARPAFGGVADEDLPVLS